jgi:hypothetical protein
VGVPDRWGLRITRAILNLAIYLDSSHRRSIHLPTPGRISATNENCSKDEMLQISILLAHLSAVGSISL